LRKQGNIYNIGEEHMNNLQSIINDFLNNMNAYEDNILEAIAHLIDVELKERDFLKNPQNLFLRDAGGNDYDN
jgi:hypothetical protein